MKLSVRDLRCVLWGKDDRQFRVFQDLPQIINRLKIRGIVDSDCRILRSYEWNNLMPFQVLNGDVLREVNINALHRQFRPKRQSEVRGEYF